MISSSNHRRRMSGSAWKSHKSKVERRWVMNSHVDEAASATQQQRQQQHSSGTVPTRSSSRIHCFSPSTLPYLSIVACAFLPPLPFPQKRIPPRVRRWLRNRNAWKKKKKRKQVWRHSSRYLQQHQHQQQQQPLASAIVTKLMYLGNTSMKVPR